MKLVVIGQGYVGLPLAQRASEAGIESVGFDLSRDVVDTLNAGRSHIDDIADDELQLMRDRGYLATDDPSVIRTADVVVICVPTPLDDAGVPNLSAVRGAGALIEENMSDGLLVVLESTTYPGTTRNVLRPILEQHGKLLDEAFYLAFSPERIDPGNPTYGLRNTPKVVGAESDESQLRAIDFYNRIVDLVVPVSSSQEAEMAKLLENTYRHINIALVNEMAKFCHELNIDIWEVIRAASTKPFGFQTFYPGPGVGGHCIPIDPNYLSYEVKRRLGQPFRFIELAQEINNSMPEYVVTRIQNALNDVVKSLRGSTVHLVGVTYKANIADQRESPANDVARILLARGARVTYSDVHVPVWMVEGEEYYSRQDVVQASTEADAVIILTLHSSFDFEAIERANKVLLDTRGVVNTRDSRL